MNRQTFGIRSRGNSRRASAWSSLRAHETLSPRCREAFALRVLEERPLKDVGRALGLSDRMAKIYVARARASIQAVIERAELSAACAAQPLIPVESIRRATSLG